MVSISLFFGFHFSPKMTPLAEVSSAQPLSWRISVNCCPPAGDCAANGPLTEPTPLQRPGRCAGRREDGGENRATRWGEEGGRRALGHR